MQHKCKILFLTVSSMALLVHLILISSYLIKPNFYSTFYSYPFFHQNWSLFVPPPTSNYNLYVRYGNKPETIDVFKELLIKHQKNRLTGYEPILIALSNSIHYFEKEAEGQHFDGGKVDENEKFLIIEKIVKNYLRATVKLKIQNLKIILCVNSITLAKQRFYFN